MTDLVLYPFSCSGRRVLLGLVVATTLSACNEQTDVAEPAPRPVRTVTLEKSEAGVPVVLTGRIEALG